MHEEPGRRGVATREKIRHAQPCFTGDFESSGLISKGTCSGFSFAVRLGLARVRQFGDGNHGKVFGVFMSMSCIRLLCSRDVGGIQVKDVIGTRLKIVKLFGGLNSLTLAACG